MLDEILFGYRRRQTLYVDRVVLISVQTNPVQVWTITLLVASSTAFTTYHGLWAELRDVAWQATLVASTLAWGRLERGLVGLVGCGAACVGAASGWRSCRGSATHVQCVSLLGCGVR